MTKLGLIVPAKNNSSTHLPAEQYTGEAGSTLRLHPRKVVYTADVDNTGGRDGGISRGSDEHLTVKDSIPGTLGSGASSEKLFTAALSASLLSSMASAARRMRIAFPEDAAVNAEINLRSTGSDYSLPGRLNISLPGISRNAALALAEAADWICSYSKAIRDNVAVTISLICWIGNKKKSGGTVCTVCRSVFASF